MNWPTLIPIGQLSHFVTREKIRLFLAIILATPIIIASILIIRLIGAISNIPARIGRHISVDTAAKWVVYKSVDVEIAHRFRDDLLFLIAERAKEASEYPEKVDRWSVIRMAEIHRQNAISQLRDGEFLLSLIGGMVSVAIGLYFDAKYAGIGIAVLILILSILVVLRIVVTEILSYRRVDLVNESEKMLLVKSGWNKTQMSHGTSLVLAAVLLTFASSEQGYNLGLRFVDWFGAQSNPIDDKRYAANRK